METPEIRRFQEHLRKNGFTVNVKPITPEQMLDLLQLRKEQWLQRAQRIPPEIGIRKGEVETHDFGGDLAKAIEGGMRTSTSGNGLAVMFKKEITPEQERQHNGVMIEIDENTQEIERRNPLLAVYNQVNKKRLLSGKGRKISILGITLIYPK